MPFVMPVPLVSSTASINMWNVNVKVGFLGAQTGMDVKFVQFLMFTDAKPRGKRLPLTGVDGKWGPKSATALAGFETREDLSRDGCVDPIKQGQVFGSISHLMYKAIFFQIGYLIVTLGGGTENLAKLLAKGFSMSDFEAKLMSMPEDNADMPADLKFALVNARDGSLEF